MLWEAKRRPAVEVALRVPGPWKSFAELTSRMSRPEASEHWLAVSGGPPVWLDTVPADSEFPSVFKMSCRRPATRDELRQVEAYRSNAVILTEGGSLAAARRAIRIGAELIHAGGAGVLIDHSALSHGGEDWVELHDARPDPMAVYYAFVNIVRADGAYRSIGMQAFGLADGEFRLEGGDDTAGLAALEDFLRKSCFTERRWRDGERFRDEAGNSLRVSLLKDSAWPPFKSLRNPAGRCEIAFQ